MQRNQKLVSTNQNPAAFLIVDVNDDLQQVAIVDLLTDSPKRPRARSYTWVQEKLNAKVLELVDHDHSDLLWADDSELKPKWCEKRDQAFSAIRDLVEDPIRLEHYLYGDPEGILQQLIADSGRSKKYVQSAINRYFRFGAVPNALLPQYFLCGKNYRGPEKPIFRKDGKTCLKSKPGRPTKYGDPYRHITLEDKAQIRAFSERLKDLTGVNLTDLYRDYCRLYCTVKVRPEGADDSDIAREFYALLPRTRLISPRAFKRYLKQCIGTLEFIRRSTGSILFERDHAGKPGVASHGLRGPLSRYEIDSTTADIYIRYEFSNDERLSIGRPTIYFVIDVVSSMVVGLHVCFHGPDWHAESQALFNAFTDKVQFCKKFGINITHEDWPCADVCAELTLDRGTENGHSPITSMLKGEIGIKAANFNAYHRGDCKGTVEKAFDTLQKAAIRQHEGKVYKVPKKEDPHPSRRAVYTYREFMKRLIKEVLFRNNNMAKTDSHNFEMCRDGVGLTPRDIWNWGKEEMIFPPIQRSHDKLRFALLKKDNATVTDKGVRFRGIHYYGKDIVELQWLDKAKNEGRYTVEIRYTDVNSSHIWCRVPDSRELIQLEITDRHKQYKNRQWEQVLAHMEQVKDALARLDEKRFTERVLLDMELVEMDALVQAELKKLNTSLATSAEPGVKDRKAQAGNVEKQSQYQEMLAELEQVSSFADIPDVNVVMNDDELTDPTYYSQNEAA